MHVHSESLRWNDSSVLCERRIIEIIAQLKIAPYERVPKCSSSNVCGRDEVDQHMHACIDLSGITPENRELSLE